MALDDQAMEFQIGMDIKDLLSRVDDLEGSFEDFVKAGEDAGDQAIDTSKSMDMMAASAESAGIAVKALTISAVALGAFGIGALLDGFTWLIKKGFEAQDMFRGLAVQTGMTIEEMDAYGDVVFESTKRYGLALREINTIATFVATNSLRGRKNIEDWSDSLAALQTFTKSNEETTRTFGDLAINLYRTSGKEAKKFGFGLEAAFHAANISFDEGVGILKSLEEVTATMPGREKEMAMQIAVATSALKDQGFTTEESIGLVNQLFDRNSRLGAQFFKLARHDLPAAVGKSLEYVRSLGLTEQNLDLVAEQLGLSRVATNKAMTATFDATKAQGAFNKTMNMSMTEIIENKKSMQSLGDLWSQVWGKLKGIFTEWGSHIASFLDKPARAFLITIGDLTERFRQAKTWGEFVGIIKDEWKKFTKWWNETLQPTVGENWDKLVKWMKQTALPTLETAFVEWVVPFSRRIGKMLFEGMKEQTAIAAGNITGDVLEAATFGLYESPETFLRKHKAAMGGVVRGRTPRTAGGVVGGPLPAAPAGAVEPKVMVSNQIDNSDVVKATEENTEINKQILKFIKGGGALIASHQPAPTNWSPSPLMAGNI